MASVTGLVLAGGQGSRMGGVDKGLQPFRGKAMAAHAIERLAPQVDEILVNANRNARAPGRHADRRGGRVGGTRTTTVVGDRPAAAGLAAG